MISFLSIFFTIESSPEEIYLPALFNKIISYKDIF